MALAGTILGWVLTVLLTFVSLMLLGMGGYLQFMFMLGIALAFFPPLTAIMGSFGFRLTWWMRAAAAILFYACLMLSLVLNPAKSIYKSPEYRQALSDIYDEKLAQWPTPCESRYIDTEYGTVHVIVSGPEDGYPILLINASGLSGWSWIFNVGALNERYRTFAVDNIGEVGRSEIKQPGYIPKTGEEIAAYYSDICSKLGIERSHVVGASVGGYIATSYALYAPERVNRLVLLGSMGYGFTPKTIATMMIAQGFPLKPIQEATFTWAFGDASHVREAFGPWFRLVMKGMVPTPIAPRSLKPVDLAKVQVPTLTFIGTRDAVVGDAQKAAALAGIIPDSTVRIVDSGHLIGAELADQVNQDMLAFFDDAGGR